jgi:hypothetical protein
MQKGGELKSDSKEYAKSQNKKFYFCKSKQILS